MGNEGLLFINSGTMRDVFLRSHFLNYAKSDRFYQYYGAKPSDIYVITEEVNLPLFLYRGEKTPGLSP